MVLHTISPFHYLFTHFSSSSMKVDVKFLVFLALSILNFALWYHYGKTRNNCDQLTKLMMDSLLELEQEIECESQVVKECSPRVTEAKLRPKVQWADTLEFEKFRSDQLASMKVELIVKTYIDDTDTMYVYLAENENTICNSINLNYVVSNDNTCFGVAYLPDIEAEYYSIKFDQDIDHYGMSKSNPDPSQIDKYSTKFSLNEHNVGKYFPSGYFRKVPKDRGRERLKDKIVPLLTHFDVITQMIDDKLSAREFSAGDDIVVMVVNEGEIDLYMNFACSCKLHDISLRNVIVFAGSSEILPMIEATGAMAVYHEGFASVSRKASTDYLDRVFVDMMWYKSFSVWLLLRKGYNILFQDVDLVWFRDPMSYFHNYIAEHRNRSSETGSYLEAFFSDDGQRSWRFAPFYGNSGFYYFLANERSVFFTWSIMAAMDAIQVLGSHQNVVTTKWVEGLSLTFPQTQFLPLDQFPSGIMFHHNKEYMQRMSAKTIHPYSFHMCWTQGKPDKLINFKKASLWFLTAQCSPLEALTAEMEDREEWSESPKIVPAGPIYRFVRGLDNKPVEDVWEQLGNMCCTSMDGAP